MSFLGWMKVRFPLQYAVLLLPYYVLAVLFVGTQTLATPSWPAVVTGFAAFWSFYLYLRGIDELHDFDKDRVSSPERPVLTRSRYAGISISALGIATLWTVLGSSARAGALEFWLALVAWATLTGFEFFQSTEWTYRHSVAFTLSHLLLMPLSVLWVILTLGETGITWSALLVASIAWCAGAVWEVTRKTRSREEETPEQYTYSRVWGIRPALAFIATSATLLTLAVVALAESAQRRAPAVRGTFGFVVVFALMYLVVELHRFAREPSPSRRRRNERAAAALIISGAGSAIVTLW